MNVRCSLTGTNMMMLVVTDKRCFMVTDMMPMVTVMREFVVTGMVLTIVVQTGACGF